MQWNVTTNHTLGIHVDGYSVISTRQCAFDVMLFLKELARIMLQVGVLLGDRCINTQDEP